MIKVVCAIIAENNKFLATQHKINSTHPLKWEFPGGKIEPFETFEQAVKREIFEELSIHIKVIEKLMWVEHNYGKQLIQLFPVLCNIEKGQIELKEHNQFGWFSFWELETLDLTAADKKLLLIEENRKRLLK